RWDRNGGFRRLGRALAAESRCAADRNEVGQAIELAIADIRLGAMLSRNSRVLDGLLGNSLYEIGARQLIPVRDELDAATSLAVRNALQPLEAEHEPAETILWRDIAYHQRAHGWQARLLHIVRWSLYGRPTNWESNR